MECFIDYWSLPVLYVYQEQIKLCYGKIFITSSQKILLYLCVCSSCLQVPQQRNSYYYRYFFMAYNSYIHFLSSQVTLMLISMVHTVVKLSSGTILSDSVYNSLPLPIYWDDVTTKHVQQWLKPYLSSPLLQASWCSFAHCSSLLVVSPIHFNILCMVYYTLWMTWCLWV